MLVGKNEDVAALKLRFPRPTFCKIQVHRKLDGSIAQCCQASRAVVQSVVQATACTGDLYTLFQYLEQTFNWGTIRANYHCQVVQHASNVDCAARTVMALEMLALYFQLRAELCLTMPVSLQSPPSSNMQLACVHVIVYSDPIDNQRWRQEIQEELELSNSSNQQQLPITSTSSAGGGAGSDAQLMRELKHRCSWIGESHCYHKCVGLINATGQLSIWDFGEVYTLNRSTVDYVGSVVSICVTPHTTLVDNLESVTWDGELEVPFRKWVDVPPPAAPAPAADSSDAIPAMLVSSVDNLHLPSSTTGSSSTAATDTKFNPTSQPKHDSSIGNSLPESRQREVISQIFASSLDNKGELGSDKDVPSPLLGPDNINTITTTTSTTKSPIVCGQYLHHTGITLDDNYFGANRFHPPTSHTTTDTTTSPLSGPSHGTSRLAIPLPVPTPTPAPVVVFISGCHMSPNPGPGVGVGRALRAKFSSEQKDVRLTLVAVDDMVGDSFQGLTDHIFDEVRSFRLGVKQKTDTDTGTGTGTGKPSVADFSDGFLLHQQERKYKIKNEPTDSKSDSEAIDDICWATLVNWLAPHTPLTTEDVTSPHAQAQTQSHAFLLPCSDGDVRLLAEKKSAILAKLSSTAALSTATGASAAAAATATGAGASGGGGGGAAAAAATNGGSCEGESPHLSQDQSFSILRNKELLACSRILCPSIQSVAACRKPQIAAISCMNCFVVPDYLLLTTNVCLSQVQTFCEVQYPVMFKGAENGAKLCFSWSEVTACLADMRLSQHHYDSSTAASASASAAMGMFTDSSSSSSVPSLSPSPPLEKGEVSFVQRVIMGTDKTILFSALEGVLTGCFLMTKVLSTEQGKVWAGDLVSVPAPLAKQLVHFVHETNWTGGGEIEFIETIEDQFAHHPNDSKKYYIIDFNPRFPAWVLGSIYTGCNLPADLIAQAIEAEDRHQHRHRHSHHQEGLHRCAAMSQDNEDEDEEGKGKERKMGSGVEYANDRGGGAGVSCCSLASSEEEEEEEEEEGDMFEYDDAKDKDKDKDNAKDKAQGKDHRNDTGDSKCVAGVGVKVGGRLGGGSRLGGRGSHDSGSGFGSGSDSGGYIGDNSSASSSTSGDNMEVDVVDNEQFYPLTQSKRGYTAATVSTAGCSSGSGSVAVGSMNEHINPAATTVGDDGNVLDFLYSQLPISSDFDGSSGSGDCQDQHQDQHWYDSSTRTSESFHTSSSSFSSSFLRNNIDTHPDPNIDTETGIASVSVPSPVWGGWTHKYGTVKGSFTRSVVELPRMNYVLDQQLDPPLALSRGAGWKGKGSVMNLCADSHAKTFHHVKKSDLLPACVQEDSKKQCHEGSVAHPGDLSVTAAAATITTAVSSVSVPLEGGKAEDEDMSGVMECDIDAFVMKSKDSIPRRISTASHPDQTTGMDIDNTDTKEHREHDDGDEDVLLAMTPGRSNDTPVNRQIEKLCAVATEVLQPSSRVETSPPHNNCNTSTTLPQSFALLQQEVSSGQPSTPHYILAEQVLEDNLLSSQQFVTELSESVNQLYPDDFLLQTQLCLSVKSQPHPLLLQAANKQHYLAECISLAEVASSLAAGFRPSDIVLTGPGKFWLGGDKDRVGSVLETLKTAILQSQTESQTQTGTQTESQSGKLILGGIYADSVSDLEVILRRVQDPTDWLGTLLVGVRFTPSVDASSRFGLDAKDPLVIQETALMVKKSASHFNLGVHFHYAMSNASSGIIEWLGMIRGFVSLAKMFEGLCGRNLNILDFGGGWTPDSMYQSIFRDGLIDLFASFPKMFPTTTTTTAASAIMRSTGTSGVSESNVVSNRTRVMQVQFELGKSLSQCAGGLICRVLCVREIRTPSAMFTEGQSGDTTTAAAVGGGACMTGNGANAGANNLAKNGCGGGVSVSGEVVMPVRQALVVDACVGDLSSPHLHPVYWQPADGFNSPPSSFTTSSNHSSSSSSLPSCGDERGVTGNGFGNVQQQQGNDSLSGWRALQPGWSEVWGRTCMEFDILLGFESQSRCYGGIALPKGMKAGDFLLFSGVGSYDMTMQYAFGDGVPRASSSGWTSSSSI